MTTDDRDPFVAALFRSSLRSSSSPRRRAKGAATRSARAKREPCTPEQYAAVMGRDRGCVLRGWHGTCSGALQWGHRLDRAFGGTWQPSNGLTMCAFHNAKLPAFRAEAERNGWAINRRDTRQPCEVPVLYFGTPVLLDDLGGWRVVDGAA